MNKARFIWIGLRANRGVVQGVSASLLLLSATAFAGQQDVKEGAIDEVVVTGSRIVRDGVSAPTPVTVVGAERLENLGATNIGAVLNTLPSFRASTSPQTSNIGPANAGMTQVDLRGLSPVRTLVLVNGRRFAPSTQQGTVDINQIPSALIERAEVVTGGASAQYGSDAVAGVVNLILKKNLDGIRANVQYGASAEGDAKDYLASLAGGFNYANGAGNLSVALQYDDNKGVGGCYTRDWCAREYQVVSNVAANKIASLPANIIAPATHNVRAVPTGLIIGGAGAAAALVGTTFNNDGTPRPFQYGQVIPGNLTFMIGGEGDNGFIKAPLISVPVQRYTAYLQNSFTFANDIESSFELTAGHMEAKGRGAQTRDFNGFVIRGDNAYLPAGLRTQMTTAGVSQTSASNFTLGRMGDDLGFANNNSENDIYRVVLGLKGKLAGTWTWDGYYQYGRSNYDQVVSNNRIQQVTPGVAVAGACTFNAAAGGWTGPGCTRQLLASDAVINPANNQIVCRSTLVNPNNGCAPLNMFGSNNWTQAAKDYVYGTGFVSANYTQHVAGLNFQGDLFNTWAGAVPLAVGAEYRANKTASTPDLITGSSGFYVSNSTAISGEVNVKEVYAETSVPLLRDLSFAKNLEINGAIRATDYNTSGSVRTWKYGVVFDPTDWLRLRSTRSQDIRAPNVNELYAPQSSGFVTVNGVLTTQVTGGNPTLLPEAADTFTLGATFRGSGMFQGLRASIDYYDIDIANAIGTSSAQLIVNRCQQFGVLCGAVTFNPDGSVGQVRATQQNLLRLKASGFDYELGYRLPLTNVFESAAGALDFSLLASRVIHLQSTDLAGVIDRAGQTGNNVSGGLPGLPEWTLNSTLTYSNGPFSTTLEARYLQDGVFDATLIGPEQAGYSVSLPNSVNTNHVAGIVYVNLGARFKTRFGDKYDIEFFGGVQNLFDRDPPVAPSNQGSSNLILFDPIGRAYRVGVRLDL